MVLDTLCITRVLCGTGGGSRWWLNEAAVLKVHYCILQGVAHLKREMPFLKENLANVHAKVFT